LDVTGLDRVLRVDPDAGTADVQGMTTYETLVDTTLAYGFMPLVVPQLKTITLGGAVAGLGIESSSFRNGLPHESVRELEVLTGDGRVVVARADNEHADLFHAFPNSYGTLGYTMRLTIELEKVKPYVRLRHLRYDTAEECLAVMAQVCADATYEGEPVQFVDGTVFSADEQYVTLGTFVDTPTASATTPAWTSSTARSSGSPVDHLTVRDYLWRWDTDWFWCSRALGVQQADGAPPVAQALPALGRLPPPGRAGPPARPHRQGGKAARAAAGGAGRPGRRDPGRGDGEVLDVFHRDIGITPIWLCPLRLRADHAWPLYPLAPAELYVNVGFWSSVPLQEGQSEGHHNRLVEDAVAALGGHKSLYSTVHYSAEEFWQRYNGPAYHAVKKTYDPDQRLPDLYEKVSG
jgi:FAD/FMN-containing dehydrogenase